MPQALTKQKRSLGAKLYKAVPKPVLIAVALVLVGGLVWFLVGAGTSTKPTAKSQVPAKTVSLHSPTEAVQTAKVIYDTYLPDKIQTTAQVGDNANLEPAAVQVARANKIHMTKQLYDSVLTDYMSEYQATGKVTKDEIACSNAVTANSTVTLTTSTKTNAIVNVNIVLVDGTTKVVPVTINLNTLLASKIDCGS